jgi:hypothetical protein
MRTQHKVTDFHLFSSFYAYLCYFVSTRLYKKLLLSCFPETVFFWRTVTILLFWLQCHSRVTQCSYTFIERLIVIRVVKELAGNYTWGFIQAWSFWWTEQLLALQQKTLRSAIIRWTSLGNIRPVKQIRVHTPIIISPPWLVTTGFPNARTYLQVGRSRSCMTQTNYAETP